MVLKHQDRCLYSSLHGAHHHTRNVEIGNKRRVDSALVATDRVQIWVKERRVTFKVLELGVRVALTIDFQKPV